MSFSAVRNNVPFLKLGPQSSLYLIFPAPYTPNVATVKHLPNFFFLSGLILLCAYGAHAARGQEPPSHQAPKAPKSPEASEKAPELPAQIELLETRVRFETNGDSRKEVHTRVHINNELGARQFARLAFDYNRAFQQIEFPLVRISHASGGTADILPSAISDQPNPAVVNAPAYQDVRVKSVRVLGLAPGDILEYRVITTTAHHPLAPDFWLDHSFDHSGVVSQEFFQIDVPDASKVELHCSPSSTETSVDTSGAGDSARTIHRWQRSSRSRNDDSKDLAVAPDVALTTFPLWGRLSKRLALLQPDQAENPDIATKAGDLTHGVKTARDKIELLYDFVSQKIATVDLPLGSTGYRPRLPSEILSSGYATPEDKFTLFAALAAAVGISSSSALAGSPEGKWSPLPRPSLFTHQLIWVAEPSNLWLDPSMEVAPFGVIPSNLRGKRALILASQLNAPSGAITAMDIPADLPFAATQKVTVDAALGPDGALTTRVHYALRGDNELLLRIAFHQASKEKWKEIAQLLAISDGFRGKITNVTASDPYATKRPFTIEYEITQPKFVDWSKKPVRIPALLPQVGLPDPPARTASSAATSPIDLGTPLDVETRLTLRLPAGTFVHTPTGTSVERDYATFASKYQATGGSVTASRHLSFLLRQIPADRAADYNAFVRAVQSDEAQEFTLERAEAELSKQSAGSNPKKN